MDSELCNLANILNIDESQIVKWEGNTSVKFPDYFIPEKGRLRFELRLERIQSLSAYDIERLQ